MCNDLTFTMLVQCGVREGQSQLIRGGLFGPGIGQTGRSIHHTGSPGVRFVQFQFLIIDLFFIVEIVSQLYVSIPGTTVFFQCPTQEIHVNSMPGFSLVLSSAFISITSVSFKTTKRTHMCPNIQGSRIIDCSISYHSNTTWRGVNCCH